MEPIIKVNRLVQKIGSRPLLQGISFEVLPGEWWGVFGARGAGKTSLLHILAGIDSFTSGQVEILGSNIRKSAQFKRKLGLVTEENSMFIDLTVVENLDFIAALKEATRDDVQEMAERFELREFLPEPVTALKSGVLQRLALACAVLNRPRLLLVDDVINQIDFYSRQLLLRELQQFQAAGGTCVCVFSAIDFSRYVTRVAWLAEGELSVYEPADARAEWHRQEKLYRKQSERDHV
ncbi:MAG: ABC transporter ATP-binding protein [Desulfotomaculaceae bacterium]|nr:ABC transporter ATP-binding protein [Desulfotomaculaceae bacterium]